MKTLSEALQLQIIDQAGATYRNVVLNLLAKNVNDVPSRAQEQAQVITEKFIAMMVDKLS